jgi:polyhydroxybutyrate depolymerase
MRASGFLILSLVLAACSSGKGTTTSASSGGTGGSGTGGSGTGGGAGGAPVIGGDRPVTVYVPTGYTPGVPAPLLIMLHGYSVNGTVEELYLGLAPFADKNGFLYAHPSGTIDKNQEYFWNATDACCNYFGSTVDDDAYLTSVVEQIEAAYSVDKKRVYFMGHSNGGFMSHRMACDHADQIAAIVSLAGAQNQDLSKCVPSSPVSVLEIHGTADTEVLFGGSPGSSMPGDGPYPGAETTVKDWAMLDGCSLTPDTSSAPLDLDTMLTGAETTVETYASGCKAGGSATLWAIQGGSHLPSIGDTFRQDVFAFMLAHPKP